MCDDATGLVPWRLSLFVLGLVLVVAAVLRHSGDRLVASITSTGEGLGALLHIAGVGAVLSNLLNNLPAYLVVEPDAAGGGPARLLALLIGTNGGSLVLLWGSLATLLWRERCKARGVVKARDSAAMGLLAAAWPRRHRGRSPCASPPPSDLADTNGLGLARLAAPLRKRDWIA